MTAAIKAATSLPTAKDLDEVVDNARKLTNDDKRALDLGEFEHDLQAIRSIYEKYQMRALELTARQKLDMTNFRVLSPALSIGPEAGRRRPWSWWPPPRSLEHCWVPSWSTCVRPWSCARGVNSDATR